MKRICCNCKHAGNQFKVGNMTHLHCSHPDIKIRNPRDHEDTGWDSLRKFGETCEHFEPKEKLKQKQL